MEILGLYSVSTYSSFMVLMWEYERALAAQSWSGANSCPSINSVNTLGYILGSGLCFLNSLSFEQFSYMLVLVALVAPPLLVGKVRDVSKYMFDIGECLQDI